jgi:endonuclease YncB( thermonuclease family)
VGCASSEPRSRAREVGRVARVTDGDTLRLADGRRVRLVQIDAPEADTECFGEAAAAALRRLAPPGTRVTLESDPGLDAVDRHGRLLRYVLSGRDNVNLELVRAGAAAPYFYRGDRGEHAAELLDAADEARAAKRGLWSACPRARLAPTRALASGPS